MAKLDTARFNLELAKRGLDGELLSELTGLHRSVISRARQGKKIRRRTLARILKALEATPVNSIAAEVLVS